MIAGAVGLRHQRVEPEQQAHPEDGEGDVQRVADAGGADRRRSERRDHDRVDDAHAHPAELGQHDRHRQTQHRAQVPSGRTRTSRAGRGWRIVPCRPQRAGRWPRHGAWHQRHETCAMSSPWAAKTARQRLSVASAMFRMLRSSAVPATLCRSRGDARGQTPIKADQIMPNLTRRRWIQGLAAAPLALGAARASRRRRAAGVARALRRRHAARRHPLADRRRRERHPDARARGRLRGRPAGPGCCWSTASPSWPTAGAR